MDTPPGRYYRKRRRRELHPEEIEKIVATSREPFQRYEDVAKEFRISKTLVGTLVKEAKKQPEKLQALRNRIKNDL